MFMIIIDSTNSNKQLAWHCIYIVNTLSNVYLHACICMIVVIIIIMFMYNVGVHVYSVITIITRNNCTIIHYNSNIL